MWLSIMIQQLPLPIEVFVIVILLYLGEEPQISI